MSEDSKSEQRKADYIATYGEYLRRVSYIKKELSFPQTQKFNEHAAAISELIEEAAERREEEDDS